MSVVNHLINILDTESGLCNTHGNQCHVKNPSTYIKSKISESDMWLLFTAKYHVI